MSESVLLDTSAILAYVDDEAGASAVEGFLRAAERHDCVLYASFVTLTELRHVTMQERDEVSADYLIGLVKSWPLHWVYPDERQCLLAARYKAQYRISLADAFVAAAARTLGATLVHKDPEFAPMAREVALQPLPYKARKSTA